MDEVFSTFLQRRMILSIFDKALRMFFLEYQIIILIKI